VVATQQKELLLALQERRSGDLFGWTHPSRYFKGFAVHCSVADHKEDVGACCIRMTIV
jgi:hypothetical protein